MNPHGVDFNVFRKLRKSLSDRSKPTSGNRRDFLKLFGIAALDFTPVREVVAAPVHLPLTLVHDHQRAILGFGPEPAWVIDTRKFSGRPVLIVSEAPEQIEIRLHNAEIPGTNLPAELIAQLTRGTLGWRIRLELPDYGFSAEAGFRDWVSGIAGLECEASIPFFSTSLGNTTLSLDGSRTLAFFPDWRLDIDGGDIRLAGEALDIRAPRAVLSVAEPGNDSLIFSRATRRSIIAFASEQPSWSLASIIPKPLPGRFNGSTAFSAIRIESVEDTKKRSESVLCAYGGNGTGLAYQPHPRFKHTDGTPFELPLREVSLVASLQDLLQEVALIADFDNESTHLQCDGCIVDVGGGEHAAPFELLMTGGNITHLSCEPALHTMASAMPDAMAGPLLPTENTRLAFFDDIGVSTAHAAETLILKPGLKLQPRAGSSEPPSENNQPNPTRLQMLKPGLLAIPPSDQAKTPVTQPSPSTVRQPAQTGTTAQIPTLKPRLPEPITGATLAPGALQGLKPGSILLPDFRVEVIRPEDFLHLVFTFTNLRLDTGAAPALVRRDPDKPAYIKAEFPPQNIHEEALWEDEGGGDPAKSPPVRSRIAGSSRLVFTVPPGIERIEYRLSTLLEAMGSFPLSVPRTALPPPARPMLRLPQARGRIDLSGSRSSIGLKRQANTLTKKNTTGLNTTALRSATAPAVTQQPPGSTPGRLTFQEWKPLAVQPGLLKALPVGPVAGKPPDALKTIIEAPYRLWLSPHKDAAWAHAQNPVYGHYGRVELWHTRLGVRNAQGGVNEHDDYNRTVRAVWSPDYNPSAIPPAGAGPFRGSLDARDRHEIVALSSDFRIPGYIPQPVWVERMMLTSMGAWLDSRGAWDPPCDPKGKSAPTGGSAASGMGSGGNLIKTVIATVKLLKIQDPCPPGSSGQCPGEWLSVEEWRHRATMGRDHYVRVVYKGYLFPFGHRVSLVKVTERKFRRIDAGPNRGRVAAYLHQRMFIVVREPELFYPDGHRKNPFRKLRITTLVTPNLDKPEQSDIDGKNRRAFWPTVAGRPFEFHLAGVDWRGQSSDFTAPAIFLDQGLAKDFGFVSTKAVPDYRSAGHQPRRQRDFDGQEVAFAEVTAAEPAATTLAAGSITFDAGVIQNCAPGDRPMFFPEVETAKVRIPAVEALTGGQESTIRIAPGYLTNAFSGINAGGQIFAEMVGASPMTFSADKAGGIATPNINIAGLSRTNGPVGGTPGSGDSGPNLSDFANGVFKPEDYFGGAALDAMILGGIKLFELFSPSLSSNQAPQLVNTPVYRNDELIAVETRLTWEPPVNPQVPVFKKDTGGTTRFRIEARIVKSLKGGEAEFSFEGILTNFTIDLLPPIQSFIEIEFSSFEFSSVNGSKPDIQPNIRDVRFKGALKYVAELAKYVGSASGGGSGGGDSPGGGLSIDVTPSGVTAGFDLSIPDITSGVMNLQNIAFSAGITLPFSGDPMRARFAFCERDNPFLLTVYCFGGGGFASLALGLDGVEQLELAFEFGASCSLDIGVASGGVEVMAGIYINVTEEGSLLSGYLRMGGQLSVLGIVRISIEFYMALSHDSVANKTWGECKLTVEIEILFFSVSVSMHVRREFSEPTRLPFKDMMTVDDWTAYCEAYA